MKTCLKEGLRCVLSFIISIGVSVLADTQNEITRTETRGQRHVTGTSLVLLSEQHSPLLLPLACRGSCLMQCPLVLCQKSTSVGSAPMPQQKMPSGCHLCPWAWILPLQQLRPLTTTPATFPILPLHHTGRTNYQLTLFILRVCCKPACVEGAPCSTITLWPII